jgi:hypothetical protein
MKFFRSWLTVVVLAVAVGCGPNGAHNPKSDRKEFNWRIENSAGDYLKIGSHDPKWDARVLRAFTNMAIIGVWQDVTNTARFAWRSDINEAVDAGCDDPLVRYFQLRAEEGSPRYATRDTLALWTNAANALQKSQYSLYRKFYGNLRAASALNATRGTNFPKLIHEYRRAAMDQGSGVLQEDDTPVRAAFEIVNETLDVINNNPKQKSDFVSEVEPILKKKWPRTWQTHQLVGRLEIDRAWAARGGGLADTVTQEKWKSFYDHLGKAERELNKAWKTEPHVETAIKMISVELGQGRGRPVMETWFARAMALDTNSYDAAFAKFNYLRPKWYGDFNEQRKFALECVRSPKWGGHVPLIMLDLHDDYARNAPGGRQKYFLNPTVWSDVNEAFEKFFKLNPDEQGWHHNYFWYAYMCKQWDEAKRELDLMGTEINYRYFGGEEEFKKMTAEVRANAPKS